MEATNYTSIGPVLQLNKAGELTQKRMKAVKVCDGLYISEPNKTQLVKMVIEYNGVMWIEHTTPAKHVDPESLAKRMPAILKNIEDGKLATMDEYRQEINRRIFNPDSPAIMELKKPERKKPAPLAENERKVNVLMFKMIRGSMKMTEKKAVITEVAPHVYKYVHKLNRYSERIKIIFEIDGVYFQRSDNGAYLLEYEDFTEVCTKAYERARDDVAAGAAKGVAYFIEVQKRINAATPTETPQISTETAETVNVSAEGDKAAERAENKPERKIKYFHYTPEQLKRYIIDVYDKRANGEWVLDHQEDTDNGYYDVLDGKVIYWHDKRANRFSFYNMDFNSPTCGRCFRINSTYQKEKYVVSNEILMEFLMGDTYRNIHKQTVYNNGKYEHYYTIQDRYGNFNVGNFSYTFDGIMQRFNDDYKDYATIIWQSPEFAPQLPVTPLTVECATEACKLAQTA